MLVLKIRLRAGNEIFSTFLSNISKGQGKAYRASFAKLRFNPYPPTMDFDDSLDYS